MWYWLFHQTHEWHTDGGTAGIIGNKNKVARTGYYTRREWPQQGGMMHQDKIIVDIMTVIKTECRAINEAHYA
jgi:hypothetical protein